MAWIETVEPEFDAFIIKTIAAFKEVVLFTFENDVS